MSLVKIELANGKYTALHHEEHGGVTVLRNGEPWRNETGDGFILSMIQHIQELENENLSLKNDLKNNVKQNDKESSIFNVNVSKIIDGITSGTLMYLKKPVVLNIKHNQTKGKDLVTVKADGELLFEYDAKLSE